MRPRPVFRRTTETQLGDGVSPGDLRPQQVFISNQQGEAEAVKTFFLMQKKKKAPEAAVCVERNELEQRQQDKNLLVALGKRILREAFIIFQRARRGKQGNNHYKDVFACSPSECI